MPLTPEQRSRYTERQKAKRQAFRSEHPLAIRETPLMRRMDEMALADLAALRAGDCVRERHYHSPLADVMREMET